MLAQYVSPRKIMTDLDDTCVPRNVFLNGAAGLDLDGCIWYDRVRRLWPRRHTRVQSPETSLPGNVRLDIDWRICHDCMGRLRPRRRTHTQLHLSPGMSSRMEARGLGITT
jgi:hypothetical protein